jgi:DNA-binding transcriptional LysR family regulator
MSGTVINVDYDMELKQLRHFLAAAETLNFSRAAERAFVSQPALSASVARLEAEFDATLFVRGKRGVALTVEGRRLVETARSVLADCARARRDLKRMKTRETVRVGVINTLSMRLVGRLLEQLRIEHPEIEAQIIDATPDDLSRLASEGRVDIAFTSSLLPGPARAKRDGDTLFDEPFVLLAPRDHPLGARRTVTLADLDGEPFIARLHCENRVVITEKLKSLKARPRVVCRTEQDERAVALVEQGLGVAIVPEHMAGDRARRVGFAGQPYARTIVLATPGEAHRPAVSKLAAFARAARWP